MKLTKGIFVSSLFFISCGILFAQYVGGDYSIGPDDKENRIEDQSTREVIADLSEILGIAAIRGFQIARVECTQNEKVKTQTDKAVDVIKRVLPMLPKDFAVVVIGHADKTGPEFSAKGALGNDYYSTMRAKSVADYIKKSLKAPLREKMIVGGSGSAKNERMVTFVILDHKNALELQKKLIQKYNWDH